MKISFYHIAGMANSMRPRKVDAILALLLGLGLKIKK
jgi:hypothetical protein